MKPPSFLSYLLVHGLLAGLLVLLVTNAAVASGGTGRIYHGIDSVPYRRVGLLLGTSQYVVSGRPNPFFSSRIDAAAGLYRRGLVDYIIASGDNQHRSYNEPLQMQKALREAGVPEEAIVLDFAGFRTLDSVVRAQKVFGVREVTIISQEFHVRRALYIARHYSLDAIAFAADDIGGYAGVRTHLREVLARSLAFFDLHLFRTRPRYLGEPVPVP